MSEVNAWRNSPTASAWEGLCHGGQWGKVSNRMKYYQVNQRETFAREFGQGYLCCPEGNWGGWPLMKELRTGDAVFHYNSTRGAVLGISRVVDIGHHKGLSSGVSVINGTQCIRYRGHHLSEGEFSDERRRHLRKQYPTHYEVQRYSCAQKEPWQAPEVHATSVFASQ